jgi:hypothetical protein
VLEQLVGADPDNAGGDASERIVALNALDVTRLRHGGRLFDSVKGGESL